MRRKIEDKEPSVICNDCINAREPHELDYRGLPFMCKCAARHENRSRFLDIPFVCRLFYPAEQKLVEL